MNKDKKVNIINHFNLSDDEQISKTVNEIMSKIINEDFERFKFLKRSRPDE